MNDAPLDELESLLQAEREAIARLDGATVLALTERKRTIVLALRARPESFSAEQGARLRRMLPALRQNGILLAHARNVLRDAVAVLARAQSPTALPLPIPPGSRLSVRG